jgi:hypothetical protein
MRLLGSGDEETEVVGASAAPLLLSLARICLLLCHSENSRRLMKEKGPLLFHLRCWRGKETKSGGEVATTKREEDGEGKVGRRFN